MDNRPEVDKIAQSLAFKVEATPQDNGLEITSTSKITPLNFKIRIRKKNEAAVQKGILSVPKLNVPERIRLISSDQTIMSFDMLMEAVINKKYSRKATRRFFGGCFKNGCDQDDSPYIKKISKSKLYGEDITSRSAGVINNSILVAKNNDQLNSNPKQPNKKTQHDYFGKCKPGGCLDPPFDEDKYSYEPDKEQILFDNSKNYNILKIKKNDGQNSIIDRLSIEKSSDRVQNKSSVLSILSLYQAQFLNNSLDSKYSDSIITYPPTLSSSEILTEKYINEKNRINGDKSRKSFNEFYETYFIPSKTTKKYINKKASIISHTNERFKDPTTLNNKVQKEIEGNSIEFIKPYQNENKTQQIVISTVSKVNQNYIDQPEKEHLYEDTTTELISKTLYEPLVEPENIMLLTLDLKSDKIITDNQTDNKITQNEVIANDNNSYISINRKSGSKMISSNFTDNVQDNYNFQTNSKDLDKVYENITNSTREINNNNNSNEAFINDKIHLKDSKLSQIATEKRNITIKNELLDTLDTNNKENCEESNSAINTYKRDINTQKNDKSNVEISNKDSKIIKYETSKKISEEPKIDDKSILSDFKQECVNPTISTAIVTVNSYKESQIKEQTSFIADDVKSENIINKCFISSLSASHIKEEIQNESPGICLNLAFQSYPGKNGNKTIKTLDASRPLVRKSDDSITIIKSKIKPDSKEIKIPIDSENYMFIQLRKDQPHLTQKNKSTFTKQTQDVSAMELNNNIESLQKTLAILYELQLVPLQNVIKSLKEEIDELARQQFWLKENLQIKKNKPIKLININKRCGCFKRYGNI
ncbi:MATH and LRR domain-containing protein PFE0570w-like [Galleria mellonella]|uniref:MATH and LRR domain-containing protein PFE0570w-like n=1 Tax=Galleria mellonella TaxID=7137 RepID=A0ABM3MXV3_GALME|nr:MATH and LRR domain-containing protein PFE0570w-like [Galleria mellonella]